MRITTRVIVFLLLAVSLRSAAAQAPPDVDRLLARYLAAAGEYKRTFRNLVAEETKTIEVYDASGGVEKRREIVSDLLVYQSPRSPAATEYRDVRSVDGKAIDKRGERALKLLERASRQESIERELKAIDRETSRYEFRKHILGGTMSQGGALEAYRDRFQIEYAGRETHAGRELDVLAYRQTALLPGYGHGIPLPKEFGKTPVLTRGRLWIDAQTSQLWRSVWEVVAAHPAVAEPLVLIRAENTYQASRFGILVPQRIVFDWLMHFTHPKNGRPSFALDERTTFAYGSFRQFDVRTDERLR